MTIEQVQERISQIENQIATRGLTEWEQDELLAELDELTLLLETHIDKILQDEKVK